jgi:PAS domain S-box-containing protein
VALPLTAIVVAILIGDLRRAVHASEELLRRELEFRSAIDSSLGEGVYALDREGHVTYMNPAAEQLLGWTEAELRGKVMHDVIHFQHADGSPFPREACAGLNDVLRSGITHRTDEDVFTRKDGRMLFVAYSAAPILRDDEVHGVVVAFRDISDRKQAEEALRQREQWFRSLVQNAPGMITVIDANGTVLYQSPAIERVLGYKPEQLVGKRYFGTIPIHPEERARTDALLAEVLGSPGATVNAEVRVGHADGSWRQIEAIATNLLHDPAVAGIVCNSRDITERKQAEQELWASRNQLDIIAELDRVRTEFIASVSHDLRTPLTAARAGLGMLETSSAERLEAAERQLLNNARRNVERLRSLIDDLLSLNQVDAGTLQLDRERLDLRVVAADAVAEVHALLREKEQTLDLNLNGPLPTKGDARRLTRVLVNLLSNANQHTPSDTHITISGWVEDGEVRLAVRDTGPGIPPAELDAIFDRFHRLDPLGKGSGLGLAIARGVIEKHGGKIWGESTLGVGTTFHIALPHDVKGAAR